MDELIQQAESIVSNWTQLASVAVSLAITIGALGVIATAVQQIKSSHIKIVTSILGVAIGIIAVIQNGYLDHDHRVYKQFAATGEKRLLELRQLSRLHHTADESNKETLYRRATDIVSGLYDVGQGPLLTIGPAPLGGFGFIASAYANPERPSWIKQLPVQDGFVFFSGVSTGEDIDIARERAHRAAISGLRSKLYESAGLSSKLNESRPFNPDPRNQPGPLDLASIDVFNIGVRLNLNSTSEGLWIELNERGYTVYELLAISKWSLSSLILEEPDADAKALAILTENVQNNIFYDSRPAVIPESQVEERERLVLLSQHSKQYLAAVEQYVSKSCADADNVSCALSLEIQSKVGELEEAIEEAIQSDPEDIFTES